MFSLTRAKLGTCRPQKQIPISISNASDRKGFIADSARSFATRRIGKREFLRRLSLAGVGLSTFAATTLGGNRRFRAVAAPHALAQTGPSADMANWLRDVGGKFKGTTIRYVSEATPPTVVAKLLAKDEFTAAWVFMQWVCSKDVAVRSALLGSGSAAVRTSTYKDPRVLAAAKVGPGTTRHFPATEWTIENAMGSEPKLPAWVEIANHIIPDELGKLLAGQYHSPQQCMAIVKEQVNKAAKPFRKG